MAYVPTTFVDRSVEFPNRRKLTAVPGQVDTFDVTRAEGTVFAEGTKLDAANLNAELDAINNSLNGISLRKGSIIVSTGSNGDFSFTNILNANTKNILFNCPDRTITVLCRMDGTGQVINDNGTYKDQTINLYYVAFDWY